MEAATAQQLSDGIDQFNSGEFYACHDTLEALWMEANEPDRTFFQGLLQVAVGLYHLTNHNWQGAVTLLGNGINRLRAYAPDYANVDVDHLLGWGNTLLGQLQRSGPEAIAEHQPVSAASASPESGSSKSECPADSQPLRYKVRYCSSQ